MEKLQKLLSRFGLSPTAARVYLALLELGKGTADTIAKRSKSYKANVYDALEKLQEVGLSSYLYEENRKIFIPTNPQKIPSLLDDLEEKKKEEFTELRQEIFTFMPLLQAKYGEVKEKELFEVYRGRKAYKALITEILQEKPKVWKGFGNLQVQESFPVEFQKWFKNIEICLFSTKTKEVIQRAKEASETTKVEIKWLPKEIYMPIVWVVFGQNVLIILYQPDIVIMRIKSDQIVKTFSSQFEYFWKKYS